MVVVKMRQETINIYQFNELSKEIQEKIVKDFSDININYEWWKNIYEDAENIGLKITAFDLYRGTIDGNFYEDSINACNSIFKDHGQHCETYQTALNYIDEIKKNEQFDIEDEFLYSLLQDYLAMLNKEYVYLTEDKSIIETIEINEFEFTKNGKIY